MTLIRLFTLCCLVLCAPGALTQLQVLEPRVETTHVVVPIAIEFPDAWLAAPPPAALSTAPLTETELDANGASQQRFA